MSTDTSGNSEIKTNESWLDRLRSRHIGHFYRMTNDRKLVFSTRGWQWLQGMFLIPGTLFTLAIIPLLLICALLEEAAIVGADKIGLSFESGITAGITLALSGLMTAIGIACIVLFIICTINANRFKPIEEKDWKEYQNKWWPEEQEGKNTGKVE